MELLKRARIALASLLVLITASLSAGPALPNEYALKAVFLYNFCRFIDWPDEAFSSRSEALVIGIVGDDPFGSFLDEAIAGENFHGRPIRIDHYRNLHEIQHCHLLFVSRSSIDQLDQIIAAVAGKNVVTVGETELFLDHGGMIALTLKQNRVQLRINPRALRGARLNVSSRLLQIADIRS